MDDYPTPMQHSDTVSTPRSASSPKSEPNSTYEALLKKTQKMLGDAQKALESEKKAHLAQLQMQEKRYGEQLQRYKEENEILRKELDRLESGRDMSEVSLRRTFFEQLEQLGASSKLLEKDLRNQIASLSAQLSSAQSELTLSRQTHAREKADLTAQLSEAQHQSDYLSKQLNKSVGDLKTKLLRTAQQLAKYSQMSKQEKTVYKEKLDLLMKHTNESEELWLREKQELVSNLARTEKTQTEKEEAISSQISLLKAEKDTYLDSLKEQMDSLVREKETASQILEESIISHSERHTALEQEILRLQTSLSRVIAYSQLREEKLQTELRKLGDEFNSVRVKQASRDESFLEFASDFRSTLAKYAGKIAEFKSEFATNDGKISETARLKAMLENKEKELVTLRDMYVTAKQSERLHVSKSLTTIQTLSSDFKRDHNRLIEDAGESLREFKGYVENCVAGLPEVAAAFATTVAQLKSSREDIERLKNDIEKVDMELEQAHLTIAGLMETVEKYERAGTDGQSETDIRVESLERELAQLRGMKIDREKRLEQEMAGLRETIGEKQATIDDLQFKLTKAKAISNVKFSEESRTLHKKFEILIKLGQKVEACLLDLKSGLHQKKKLKELKNKAETEELILLRTEVKRSDQTFSQLSELWEKSKSGLESEIASLSAQVCSVSSQCTSLSSLVSDQHSLLTLQAEQLQHLRESQPSATHIEINAEAAPNELTAALQNETAALREQIRRLSESHSEELAELKRFYEGEEQGKRLLGFSVSKEMHLQAEKLKQLTLLLENERQLHQHEVSLMRQEVTRLRAHCLQRYELLHSDRQEVISELKSVLSSACSSQTASRKSLYQGIRKMREMIDAVKGGKRESEKLHCLQEELGTFKSIEDERVKAQDSEREALNGIIEKLKDAYSTLLKSSTCEKEDHALELRLLEGRVSGLEQECSLLRQQRDEVLSHLGKTSETASNEVSLLLEQLKETDKQRSVALSQSESRSTLRKTSKPASHCL